MSFFKFLFHIFLEGKYLKAPIKLVTTIYLPLYPSLFSDVKKLDIKETYPEKQKFSQKVVT